MSAMSVPDGRRNVEAAIMRLPRDYATYQRIWRANIDYAAYERGADAIEALERDLAAILPPGKRTALKALAYLAKVGAA